MKNCFKAIMLLCIGLLVAVFVYPLLHESGHVIFALLSGGRLVSAEAFPFPSVLCDMSEVGNVSVFVTGIGGMLLPFVVALFLSPENFFVWYLSFVLKCINMQSFVVSLVCAVLHVCGKDIYFDDIVGIMKITPEYGAVGIVFIVVMLVSVCLSVIKSRPVTRCIRYFEV